MNKLFVFTLFYVAITTCAFAQHKTNGATNKTNINNVSTEFCPGVNKIIADAPNKFKNISGKQTKSWADDVEWECKIKICDSCTGDVDFGAGIWTDYIGTLYASLSGADAFDMYNKYKDALSACLTSKGYVGEVSTLDHFWRSPSDAKVFKYRVMDENFVPDMSMPTITLEFDSAYVKKGLPPKRYWILLDIWGFENYR